MILYKMNTYSRLSNTKTILFTFFMITCTFHNPTNSEALRLTMQNIDTILASNELVLINFCVERNRLCKPLTSTFDEAADVVAKKFPESGKVVMGKVNGGDLDSSATAKFRIAKFPALKIFRNGQLLKGVYKGERSVEGFTSFIKTQLEDPINEFKQLKELQELESNKGIVIGYFDHKDQPEYDIFRRVATNLRDHCQFHVGFDEASRKMHPPGHPTIVFRKDKSYSNYSDEIYDGNLTTFDWLHTWASEKCDPLIKELTLENAEEFKDEGLPLLILFHKQDDNDSIKRFKKIVQTDLLSEKKSIGFATADGKAFAHSLRYFFKGEKDLPLIAIDNFMHMFLFPNYKDIEIPDKLKQFVQDLYSGKLHREYHYGPDREL